MGKSDKKAKTVPATKEVAATTSIDDIFAGSKASSSKDKLSSASSSTKTPTSAKAKAKAPAADILTPSQADGPAKKKKTKKSAPTFDPSGQVDEQPQSRSSRVVEVVDPSLAKPEPKVTEVVAEKAKKVKKRERKEDEEDEMFADSRGTGPRRKTEEGFLIYKEAELRIDPEAGGTPLCPFDCECCF